jgi:hypothetical protein
MSLTGWQAVACLLIAAGLGVAAAWAPAPAATVGLFNLAAGIVGGTYALLQRNRDPSSRGRASDRTLTAPGGVPLERTPPPETQLPRR